MIQRPIKEIITRCPTCGNFCSSYFQETGSEDSVTKKQLGQSPENNSLEEQVSIGDDGLSLVGKVSISDEEPIYKPKTLPAPKDEELCRCKHRKEDHLEEAGECRHYTELTPPKKYAGYSCSCKEYTPHNKTSMDAPSVATEDEALDSLKDGEMIKNAETSILVIFDGKALRDLEYGEELFSYGKVMK